MPIRLNGSTSGYTEIDAPAVAGSNTLVLPTGNGSSGQVLSTNGSGALSWATVASSKILQVVSTTKTDAFSTSGTSFADVTGLSVTITPSSTSSKVFIFCSIQGQGQVSAAFCATKLVRGSTDLAIGDANSSAARVSSITGYTSDAGGQLHMTISYLDSPSTTSATTYKVQACSLHSGASCFINRPQDDSGVFTRARCVSSITAVEVAA